jgi:flagellar motor switch protein FliN/FliY
MADENDTDLPLPTLEESVTSGDMPAATRGVPVPKVPSDLEQLFDVPVTVSAVLGHARMAIADLLKIGPGSLLELDRRVGEAIDILVNNRLVARGEVVLVDERLGVTMTEIVRSDP